MEKQPNTEATTGAVPLDCKVMGSFDDAEQAAFEDWLHKTRPSGDVEEVQRKWLTSHEYMDFLDEQEPFSKTRFMPPLVE